MADKPAPITLTHTPKSGEATTWELDYSDITVGEVMDLERFAERPLQQVEYAIAVGHRTSLMLLWFVYRRRTEPDFTLEDLHKVPWHEVEFTQEKRDPKADDEGKAPADDGEGGETPAA